MVAMVGVEGGVGGDAEAAVGAMLELWLELEGQRNEVDTRVIVVFLLFFVLQ